MSHENQDSVALEPNKDDSVEKILKILEGKSLNQVDRILETVKSETNCFLLVRELPDKSH